MQRYVSMTSVIRALLLLCVIAIGFGAPHSRKGGDATGSASEALSFTGIGDVASVTPGLQCVADFSTPNAVGSFVAVFRATNVSSQTVVVPLGPTNQISPTPAGAGPPTSFAPGTQYFTVSFVAHLFESITWTLGTRTASASRTSTACVVTQGQLGPVVQTASGEIPLRLDPDKVLANTVKPTETDATGFAQGAIPAAFSVTPDGAASYVMNLWTSPGTGVQPNVSLVYNSRFGQSIAGVGFQLTGFSQITRCPSTMAQDLNNQGPGPVNFGPNGPFCLDGVRLIADSTTQFHPENDQFTRVLTDSARSKFTVLERSGRVLVYGGSPAARLFGTRRVWVDETTSFVDVPDQVYAWALESVRDRAPFPNEMRISYRTLRSGPGQRFVELLPSVVTYTPNRRIEIKYDDEVPQFEGGGEIPIDVHPRPNYRFVSGLGLAQTRVATRLQMFGPDPVQTGVLRTYIFHYQMETALTQRPRLASVKECDRAGACLPETKFDWEEGDGSFQDIPIPNAPTTTQSRLVVSDLNGDGMDDIYYRISPSGEGFRFGNRNGLGEETLDVTLASAQTLLPVDLFMDGPQQIQALFSDQVQFFQFGVGIEPLNIQLDMRPRLITDLNGDGRPDLLENSPSSGSGAWRYVLHQGGSTPFPISSQRLLALRVFSDPTHPELVDYGSRFGVPNYVADVDGSGRNAILIRDEGVSETGVTVNQDRYVVISGTSKRNAQNTGVVTEIRSKVTTLVTGTSDGQSFHHLLLDINGDGNADALQVPNAGGEASLAVNNGSNFEQLTPLTGLAPMNPVGGVVLPEVAPFASGAQVGDWNEDGVSDVILLGAKGTSPARTNVITYTSNRSLGFEERALLDAAGTPIPAGEPLGDPLHLPAADGYILSTVLDVNGDGLMDFIQPVGGQLHLYLHRGKKADLLKGVAEGQGKTYAIDHRSMHDLTIGGHSLYRPILSCPYPQYCIRRGMWLVASHTVTSDDDPGGAGRTRQYSYQYADARSNLRGHGFIAMGSRTVTDQQTGTVVTTVYDQSTVSAGEDTLGYPTAGLVKAELVATPVNT